MMLSCGLHCIAFILLTVAVEGGCDDLLWVAWSQHNASDCGHAMTTEALQLFTSRHGYNAYCIATGVKGNSAKGVGGGQS